MGPRVAARDRRLAAGVARVTPLEDPDPIDLNRTAENLGLTRLDIHPAAWPGTWVETDPPPCTAPRGGAIGDSLEGLTVDGGGASQAL